jgi:hypothetical protein
MAERYPSEPDDLTIVLPENAQLTYEELRSTLDGERVGYLDGSGDWADVGNGYHWSDVVIGPA